jgi:hypothetical protein
MRILHSYKIYYPDVFGGIPEVIAALVVGMQQRAERSVLVARPRGWHRSLHVDGGFGRGRCFNRSAVHRRSCSKYLRP